MTAQIPDNFRFNRKSYDLVAMTNSIDFDPEDHGLKPVPMHTACWRGFFCDFKITKKGLFLDRLNISTELMEFPDLWGSKPKVKHSNEDSASLVYEKINHKIDYTGSIVLGDGFLDEYYIHMGFQRPWAYESVVEVVFENGNLVKTIDHSETVAKIREEISSGKDFESRKNLFDFVTDSFSLDARTKAWWLFEEF